MDYEIGFFCGPLLYSDWRYLLTGEAGPPSIAPIIEIRKDIVVEVKSEFIAPDNQILLFNSMALWDSGKLIAFGTFNQYMRYFLCRGDTVQFTGSFNGDTFGKTPYTLDGQFENPTLDDLELQFNVKSTKAKREKVFRGFICH